MKSKKNKNLNYKSLIPKAKKEKMQNLEEEVKVQEK